MKFRDLPIGQAFRFDGCEWIKSGPIAARPVGGGATRMIPQSARVDAEAGDAASESAVPQLIDGGVARAALEVLFAAARELVLNERPPAEALPLLEQAREAALKRLTTN